MMLGNTGQQNKNGGQTKHQGRVALRFLDPNFKEYEISKFYQLEISIQMTVRNANSTHENRNIGGGGQSINYPTPRHS
eukprot:10411464-Ditylum_brightwellii.AAC.1